MKSSLVVTGNGAARGRRGAGGMGKDLINGAKPEWQKPEDYIRQEHEAFGSCEREALQHAINAGEELNRLRAELGSRKFKPWLEQHLPELPRSSAYEYIYFYERRRELAAMCPEAGQITKQAALAYLRRTDGKQALIEGDGLPPGAPGKRYPILYADPPWQYDNSASTGAASRQYATISTEQLRSDLWVNHVNDLSMRNSAIFLWATVPMFPEALQVLERLGASTIEVTSSGRSPQVWAIGHAWRTSICCLGLGVVSQRRTRTSDTLRSSKRGAGGIQSSRKSSMR